MKSIALQDLLNVMSLKTFYELKCRGRLVLTRCAPHTEVDVSSLPIRFQEALSHLPIP